MKEYTMSLMAAAVAATFTVSHQPGNADSMTKAAVIDTNLIEQTATDKVIDPLSTHWDTNSDTRAILPPKPSAAQIKAAFDAFDSDKSGQLANTELEGVLIKSGVKVTNEQCKQLIKMFDANNSGMMEFNEYERLIEEALKHAK
jgi:hypothetical protein